MTGISRVMARALLFIVACAVTLAIVGSLASTLSDAKRLLATGVVSAVAAYVLCRVFLRWDRLGPDDVGVAIEPWSVVRFALGFATGLLLVGLWAASCAVVGRGRWVLGPAPSARRFGLIALAYVALATREELAFRGYPLRRLAHCCGPAVAQVVVAVLFALEHRIGGSSWPDALLGVGVGSILFGAAALATRGLAVPIGLHAAWNIGQWALGLKGEQGLWALVTPQSPASAYRIALGSYVVVTSLAAVGFLAWQRLTQASSRR